MNTVTVNETAKAAELPDEIRDAVRDLILVLADSKRVLGMRYGQWILGAPELEAGIACASMAQDEWGHGRLLYALLREFGEDVDHLEHGRQAGEYRSIEAVDREPQSWTDIVAVNALVDTALTVQLEALARSAYVPLRQRVQKLIEEEAFHAAHGAAWFRRIAGSDDGRQQLRDAVSRLVPAILRWFGPDSPRAQALLAAGMTDATGAALRTRFLQRAAPLLTIIGAEHFADPDFAGFDETRRRNPGTAPDERTIAQIRGDRNRAFLMD